MTPRQRGRDHCSQLTEVLILGVGVAQHSLEVVATAVERSREHQPVLQKLLTGALAPALGRLRIHGGRPEREQMQRPLHQQKILLSAQQRP